MKKGLGRILFWIVMLVIAYWLYWSGVLGYVYNELFPEIVRELLKETLRAILEHL